MTDADAKPDERHSFVQHLEELRKRLVYSLVAVLGGFLLCYSQVERIFGWLVVPLKKALPDSPLVMIKLTEGFMTYLRLGLWAGLLLASPVVLYQVWAFVAPGLYRHERRLVGPLVMSSTVLFALGCAFTYYFVFPLVLKFLMEGFVSTDVKPMLSVSSYVASACLFMATFGLIFQIPLVMLLLARLGIVKATTLAKNRKYVLLVSFIVGAVFSPPDIFSQCIVSIPLFLVFEIGIWAIRLQNLFRRPQVAPAEKAAE